MPYLPLTLSWSIDRIMFHIALVLVAGFVVVARQRNTHVPYHSLLRGRSVHSPDQETFYLAIYIIPRPRPSPSGIWSI